jgi:peptide/nickel transport system ATP-binding protein
MSVLQTGNTLDAAVRAESQPNVAEVDNLSITFQRGGQLIHALRGVSLEIRQGEILGLVGESGSGKSVLGMSLLGLLPREPAPRFSGRITVCGQDMVNGSLAAHRRIRKERLGAVFQDPMSSLNPTMRIGKQVTEAAGSESEAVRLLGSVGVPEPESRMASFPHELSGGLRQRVMVAMAVAGNPELVVADEPTTALDVTVQAQVLGLLKDLRDGGIGCSFLLITHDLSVAAQVADRIAVLYAGRIAEVGTAREVLRSAAHPYSIGLLASRLSLSSDRHKPLSTLRGEVPSPAAPPPGCPFEPRCDFAIANCAESLPEPRPVGAEHLTACIRPAAELVPPAAVVEEPAEPPSAPAKSTMVAGVEGVEKTYRVKAARGRRATLHALAGVDLRVAEGESVAIVGESGSGKSTLLRIVAGLERADRGDVAIEQDDQPQMVFQDAGASLTPWLPVGELIGERLRSRRMSKQVRRERVAEALTQVGLPPEVAGARAGQLSGGQRQRVALARATVIPPKLLLCDEPTSALDVSLAAAVLNLLAKLRRELGMAVVFVTHDLSVARIVADRIAVMYLGRIVELGAADEVVNQPRHPYTKALVAAIPASGVAPATVRGEPASPLSPPSGCAFHPRCPHAEETCADPDLEPRLVRMRRDTGRWTACIRADAI